MATKRGTFARVPILVLLAAFAPGESTAQQAPATVQKTCADAPVKYTVVKGDNLSRIAGKFYGGRRYMWPVIYEHNREKIGTNPDRIFPGMELLVPVCPDMTLPAYKFPPVKRTPPVKRQVTPPPPPPPPTPAPIVREPQTQEQHQEQTVNIIIQVPEKREQQAPPPPPPPQPPPVKQFVPPPPQAKLPPKEPVMLSEPTIAPGSAWNSFLTTPLEPGNWINYGHLEQRFVIAKLPGKINVMPYVSVDVTRDTKGFTWNNRVLGQAGLSLARPFKSGIVGVQAGYGIERRAAGYGDPAETRTGLLASTFGWFGWQTPTARPASRTFFNAAPGSFQWNVGRLSSFERRNIIGVLRMEQGVTLAKVKGVSIIPTGIMQFGFDTQDKPWNNRYTYAGMMKIAMPWTKGIGDIQAGYQCSTQYSGTPMLSGRSSCGPGFSVNVWGGWRPGIGGH